jgi:hypothetical protein
VRWLNNKPVGKYIKWNALGLRREIIKFRQYPLAKPGFDIDADSCFVCYLVQHGAAVKQISAKNFFVERYWPDDIREYTVRLSMITDKTNPMRQYLINSFVDWLHEICGW